MTQLLVATCVYNPLDVARLTIESALKHTDVDFRYVLVYNHPPYRGHRDEFYEYVRGLDDDRVLILDVNRNTGCHGGVDLVWDLQDGVRYLAKVDDDTIVAPGWASKIIHGLQLDETIAALSSDITARSRDPIHRGRVEEHEDGTKLEFMTWCSWSAVIVPAHLRAVWGRFPISGLYGGEEHWWSARAQEAGMRVGYHLGTMAFHADVHSRPRWTVWKLISTQKGYPQTFDQMVSNRDELKLAYFLYADYFMKAQAPIPLTVEDVLDGR